MGRDRDALDYDSVDFVRSRHQLHPVQAVVAQYILQTTFVTDWGDGQHVVLDIPYDFPHVSGVWEEREEDPRVVVLPEYLVDPRLRFGAMPVYVYCSFHGPFLCRLLRR